MRMCLPHFLHRLAANPPAVRHKTRQPDFRRHAMQFGKVSAPPKCSFPKHPENHLEHEKNYIRCRKNYIRRRKNYV